MKDCCDMKGFLSFIVLRLISQQEMSGQDIRREIGKRKEGAVPSPGTIYPVLKSLRENGWIEEIKPQGKEKHYRITAKGKKEIKNATRRFMSIFCDMRHEFKRD